MKRIIILLSSIALLGCPGQGMHEKFPKHDLRVICPLIRAEQDNYYLFRGDSRLIRDGYVNEKDTLTIGDSLYSFVFFAKIEPKKLHKKYDLIPSVPGLLYQLYIRGDFVRKPIPGYGNREFSMAERIVGVQ